jgi:hypothetical protein
MHIADANTTSTAYSAGVVFFHGEKNQNMVNKRANFDYPTNGS